MKRTRSALLVTFAASSMSLAAAGTTSAQDVGGPNADERRVDASSGVGGTRPTEFLEPFTKPGFGEDAGVQHAMLFCCGEHSPRHCGLAKEIAHLSDEHGCTGWVPESNQ